jgi:membrane protease YdiL (CAAX protease family)
MYLKQAFKIENDWWLYLLGLLIVVAGIVVGQIPLTIAVMLKAFAAETPITAMEDPYEILGILDSNLNLFLMLLTYVGGLLAVFFTVRVLHRQSLVSLTTSRKKIDWGRFWFAFILWGVFTVFFIGIEYFTNPENYSFNFELVPFVILVIIALIFVPLQTSFEEYLFRGYWMQGLAVLTKNRWLPLVITSVVFGAMHLANPEIDKLGYILLVHYIGTGFLLGIMTLMDEGLELALGFHAANNLVASILVTADWTAFQTNSLLKDTSDPSAAGFEVFIPVFIIYPLVLYVFSKKYNWVNWREKLFGKLIND